MTQPALVTGSISSAIGMGGGTTGAQPNFTDGAGPTGRFTGGVRFSDPALQGAFSDPLTAEDYEQFLLSAPSYGVQRGVDMGGGPGAWGVSTTYGTPVAPSTYDWGSFFSPSAVQNPDTYEILGGGDNAPKIYRGGAEISDPASLNDRERRAYQALRDPKSASVFDLQSHPAYSTVRQSWYTSPFAMGQKYGFTPKFGELSNIENQYKSGSPGYIPMDFFAKSISDKLATSDASTYGNLALATDTLDAWRQQPALGGQFSSVDDFPSLWGGRKNTAGKQAERAYIAEELTEDSGGGLFGGSFFGKLLSFAAPILSFIPGLQPLGWALGAVNSLANGNPLGALLSLAGPIMSSMSSGVSNFSGVGDFSGGGLVAPSDFSFTAPSDFSFGDSLSSSWSGGGIGLQAPSQWGYGGFSADALPGISLVSGATGAVPGFSAGDLGTGLTVPAAAAATFGTPAWQVGGGGLFDNKLVQQAAKGALKLGAKGLMSSEGAPDAQNRLAALRNAQERQKGEAPMLQQPQGMAPAATPAAAASEERWRRLRYGNEPVLEGNVVPQ